MTCILTSYVCMFVFELNVICRTRTVHALTRESNHTGVKPSISNTFSGAFYLIRENIETNVEMEKEFDRGYIKKGPWSSEEDEVLLRHVTKYGPREWSSIRSKGLLPRTGKSCRLRWVNKLRPNLKTGCKFTAEEERLVIELQAQFGNKWAKIATYLHGRTDNDVKNFWSSRRKRLERMLQRPPTLKPHKNKGKLPLNLVQVEKVPPCSSNQVEENLSYLTSYMGNNEVFEMINLPDLIKPNYQYLESDPLSAVEVEVDATPLHTVPSFESSSGYNFPLLPEPLMDYPLFPECHDLVPEPFDPNFIDEFEQKKCSEGVCSQELETMLPTLGFEGNSQSTSSNGLFKDFSSEIFEYFEQIPTSSEV
uniref:Transcription factor GAMYB n=1 Tax=Cajanus cajan TaxID=3821 RepID=A0A151S5I5_CAJCA|nr:Transcription factor GAMYB [Cajanus cajan]